MAQEVTIKISVPPEEGAVARSAAAESGQGEPARPLDLANLQLSGAAEAPAPVAPAELAALTAGGETAGAGGGEPAAPLPIEQLQGVSAGAPTPELLTAVGGEAGAPPAPMPVEELEGLNEAGNDDDGGENPPSPRSTRRRPRG